MYNQNPAFGFVANPGMQYNNAAGYPYATYMQPNSIQVPMNQNALTPEEIQRLRSMRPSGMLNLQISDDACLRAMCNHCDRGMSVVQECNDGSGDVWCPICGSRWQPQELTKEDVQELCNKLIASFQSTKWCGELPTNIIREYFTMIPLIEKYPDIFEYASKNMNRMLQQRGYYNAQDANINAQYNNLFNSGYGYNQQPWGQMQYNQGWAQQPQPMYNYYNQPIQQANPNINPMAPQQPMQPGYNPQFASQANMMMPGYPVGQPGPNQFSMGQPIMQQPQQPMGYQFQPAQPMVNQQQPQQTPQVQQPSQNNQPIVTENKKIDL